jgi:hypothetical protein
LRAAGFDVESRHPYAGPVEADVFSPTDGTTKLQRVQAGAWKFFKPVPDVDFGWRLHIADLGVNKAVAAGGKFATTPT